VEVEAGTVVAVAVAVSVGVAVEVWVGAAVAAWVGVGVGVSSWFWGANGGLLTFLAVRAISHLLYELQQDFT
jgi:hypothetical protein